MSAGRIVENYIDCNARDGCLRRITRRDVHLAEGATLEMIRKAAEELGWQVGVPREDNPLGLGRKNSRQDFCGEHRTDGGG
jgi:hypothetical protein